MAVTEAHDLISNPETQSQLITYTKVRLFAHQVPYPLAHLCTNSCVPKVHTRRA